MNIVLKNEMGNSHKVCFSEILMYIYFALTFFEPYLNGVFGSITKYYIFVLIAVLVFKNNGVIKLRKSILPYILWLAYLFTSLAWAENLYIYNLHGLSQIGMTALLVVLTSQTFEKRVINNVAGVMMISGFIIGILTLIYAQAYHGVAETRQVLVLFGHEVDPNNQAAFLVSGIGIAVYNIVYGRKLKILSFAVMIVNSIAMFRTGSRGGLISLAAILIFVVVFNEKNKGVGSVIKKLIIIAGILYVFYYVLRKYIPQDIYDRLLKFDSYEGGSERTVIWKNGLKLLNEDLNIIFGAGWGDYYWYNGFKSAMHNTYLAMLCDVGIIGFLLFFIPVIQHLFYCLKQKEYLPIMILIAGLAPCFFLDAINKRFFWNAIMFMFMFTISNEREKKNET